MVARAPAGRLSATAGSDTRGAPPPGRRDRRRWWLLAAAVGVPAVVFGLPAALGAPWFTGDNLIQNFPLRVLVGTDLRAGHLPLWDPFLWSGSPLLAGFNAGAAYPFTWLFAVLPHVLAWVANQVVVEVVAATGMFTFLVRRGQSRTASLLGALSFAYGGFVALQSIHIDLVQAAGWLAWAFVGLDAMAEAPSARAAAPWVALLGVSLGLMVLSGAAEPILDGGVALALYTLWLIWDRRGHRLRVALGAVAGAALGVMVGAAQLLPGSALQGSSQRAAHDLWYFTSGSMNKSLTVLLVDPLLLGGGHGVPLAYVGTYNLAEVCGYVGILPLMAVLGLLARRHRRSPEARRWWIWYVIAALGVVLVWGGFTPLGHLEYLVPLYNRQRLLARNWLEVDFALCVLLAVWVDRMLLGPAAEEDTAEQDHAQAGAGHDVGRWARLRRLPSSVVLAWVPPALVVVLQVVLLAGGGWFPHTMHVPGPVSYGNLWPQGLLLTVPSALGVGAAWLVWRGRRLGPVRLGRLLVALVVADLAFFDVMAQVTAPTDTAASAASAPANALAATVAVAPRGPGGRAPRMALVDPDRYLTDRANAVGQPDLTVLRGLRSVQGYGALVSGAYDAATGAHTQGNLSPAALGAGTLQGLDLGVLLAPPEYFVHLLVPPTGVRLSPIGDQPLPPGPPDRSPAGAAADAAGAPPTPVRDLSQFFPAPSATTTLGAGGARTFFFGTVLAVSAVTLPATGSPGGGRVRVGLLGPTGAGVRWLDGPAGEPAGAAIRLRAPGAPPAAGLVLAVVGGAGATVGTPELHTAGQGTYRLDGPMRDVVGLPTWRFTGTLDGFGVFEERPAGAAFVSPAGAGTARVVDAPPWGTDRIEVTTSAPATLVRNEAFADGWQASITAAGRAGPAVAAPVERRGLVQAVRVPAGTHVVTFRYRPHRVLEGLALSTAGVLVALGLVIAGRRRRAPGPRRRGAGARPAGARSARAPGGGVPGPATTGAGARAGGPPPRGP